jgi:DNA repair protein RadC
MPSSSHEGHRTRLRSRFAKNEAEPLSGFADYEIVELLLTFVDRRGDTKPLAKELLKRFKTVYGILNAAPADLLKVPGVGNRTCELFALVRETAAHSLREKLARQPLRHRSDVEEYLRFNFGGRGDEYVAVIYLDNGNNVIAAEIEGAGTVNQCVVYPRDILQAAFRCKAAKLILAHNHPGGAASPSESDWNITLRMFELCRLLDIELLDHVIVARDKAVSLRDLPRWPVARTAAP